MKKMFICLATILSSISLTVNAEAVITVSDVYAQAGSTAYFTLDLSGGRAGVYESLDFAFTLPDGFSLTDNFESNWEGATIKSGKTVGMMNDTYLETGDFNNLVSVEFSIDKNVAVGTYQIKLDGFDLGYNKTQHDYPAAVTFNVFVTDVLTLDENSQVAPKLTSDVCKMKVLRTLKKDEWSTICLPFYMTKEEAETAFGKGYQLADFYDYTVTKNGSDVVEINVQFIAPEDFEEEDGLYPNVPYILKPAQDVEEFVVEEQIEEIESNPTKNSKTKKSGKYIGKFIGTYVANTLVPEKSAFLSGNKFWYSVGKTKMKAFRAYFTFNDILADFNEASSRINFYVGDGENLTEIQIPELMPNDGEYYNLNGLRVETPSKGIYIKDGKKVVVK